MSLATAARRTLTRFPFIFLILVIARFWIATLPGYIHPDEFFQGPEVMAGDMFGISVIRTWEFTGLPTGWPLTGADRDTTMQDIGPVRSIVPVYLYSGVPFTLYRLFMGRKDSLTSPGQLFYLSRLYMASLTLTIDFVVYRVLGQVKTISRRRVWKWALVVATSQCLAVFHTHTFSNALASELLAIGILVWYQTKFTSGEAGNTHSFWFGAVVVLGVFAHVTFLMFVLPLVIAYLQALATAPCSGPIEVQRAGRGGLRTARFLRRVGRMFLGAVVALTVVVVVDSLYYGTLELTNTYPYVKGALTLTPLNNLRYNSLVENLALHGLHPWYLHLVVSVPVMLGPLAGIGGLRLAKSVLRGSWWAKDCSSGGRGGDVSRRLVARVMGWMMVVGLTLLSLIPHKEARFIIPLFVPAVLGCACSDNRDGLGIDSKLFAATWLMYNLVTGWVYGGLHQAGVVPAIIRVHDLSTWSPASCLLTLHADAGNSGDSLVALVRHCDRRDELNEVPVHLDTLVVFYKTYMPPRHLFGQRQGVATGNTTIQVVDIGSNWSWDSIMRANGGHVPVPVPLPWPASQDDGPEGRVPKGNWFAKVSPPLSPGEIGDQRYARMLVVAPASSPQVADIVRQMSAMAVATEMTETSNLDLALVEQIRPHVNFDDIGDVVRHPVEYSALNIYLLIRRTP